MSERVDIQELKKTAESLKGYHSFMVPVSTILALIEIARVAEATALNYERLNPMRTADFHGEHCSCLRCSIDRLRTALEGVKK